VIGLEDVESILGKRPFCTQEMRNIDRYRHGASGKPPVPPSEVAEENSECSKEQPPEEGGGPGAGKAKEPGFLRRVEPGAVVAT
jgi:hypothetical protein